MGRFAGRGGAGGGIFVGKKTAMKIMGLKMMVTVCAMMTVAGCVSSRRAEVSVRDSVSVEGMLRGGARMLRLDTLSGALTLTLDSVTVTSGEGENRVLVSARRVRIGAGGEWRRIEAVEDSLRSHVAARVARDEDSDVKEEKSAVMPSKWLLTAVCAAIVLLLFLRRRG